jgi:hypothetical protein
VSTDQIDNVVVHEPLQGGIYIYITTRKDYVWPTGNGIVKKFAAGYKWRRKFYEPQYGPDDLASSIPDHRATLYWNPNLVTNKRGQARVRFYNSDAARRFLVVVEGLAPGMPGTVSKVVGTQNR